ncbi:MAG: DGQHR domain-containing protein [Thermoplasmata archaeon]
MTATKNRVEIPVVSAQQFGRTMYVGAVSAADLARLYDSGTAMVDVWDPNSPKGKEGYQRVLSRTRARKFGRFLGEKNLSPTSILIYVRDPDSGVEIHGDRLVVPVIENAQKDPDRALLFLVDGQHRTYGISEGFKEGWIAPEPSVDLPVTVIFSESASVEDPILEEAHQFLTLNNEQKRVRTDLAHQLILRKENAGKGTIRDGTTIPSGVPVRHLLPYITAAANQLSEKPGSAWHDRIVRPNTSRNTTGLPSQGQFEDSLLDNYLGMGSVASWAGGSGFTVGELVQVLSNYWEAVFDLCPGAVSDPDSHVLTKTAGIHALNGVLPALFAQRRNLPRIPSAADFKSVLKTMGNVFEDDYWSSTTGEAAGYGTSKKSFKELCKAIADTLSTR